MSERSKEVLDGNRKGAKVRECMRAFIEEELWKDEGYDTLGEFFENNPDVQFEYGAKYHADTRRWAIAQLWHEKRYTLRQLAAIFDVSMQTISKDLQALDLTPSDAWGGRPREQDRERPVEEPVSPALQAGQIVSRIREEQMRREYLLDLVEKAPESVCAAVCEEIEHDDLDYLDETWVEIFHKLDWRARGLE